MSPSAEVDAIVEALQLAPHPEGGFYRETFRSSLVLEGLPHGAPRAASTAIYYLLPGGATSAFHHVRSDEIWHYYAGDPLELHTIDPYGRHEQIALGPDLARGERPQHVVPAGVLQGAFARGRYTLCGCTVAPGFDFADWVLPSREELWLRFPAQRALIAALTRA